ncbi:MAG: CBASS cGAMP synthase [bacterium]
MANCNKLFLDFNEELKITSTKKSNIMTSKNKLREKIKKHFKDNHPEYKPKFKLQGSYRLNTLIRTKEDTCDLDDGVYFLRKPDKTGTTLQKWVKKAVEDATNTPPEHREKCIRVIYKGDYHIDLPVYYFDKDNDDHPHIAIKNNGWEESDPKEFLEWFNSKKDDDRQLVRIVKYLKAWCDHKRNKMPDGMSMTILAEENINFNKDRDDKTLRDTLEKMRDSLKNKFECKVPTTPKDDVFEDYNDTRKNNFLDNLDAFIDDANKAIDEEKNQLRASKLWQKHLGSRFPDGADENVDEKEEALNERANPVLSGTAFTQRNGRISKNNDGVPNKEHRNYGSSS